MSDTNSPISLRAEIEEAKLRLRSTDTQTSEATMHTSDLDAFRWGSSTLTFDLSTFRALWRAEHATVEPASAGGTPPTPRATPVEMNRDGSTVDVSIGDATGLFVAIASGQAPPARVRRHKVRIFRVSGRHRGGRTPVAVLCDAMTSLLSSRGYWRIAS